MTDYIIRTALPKDAPAICKLRRKVWLATYPSEAHNITRELLLKLFDFTSSETISHYRQLIAGERTGFTGDDKNEAANIYAANCQIAEQVGDIGVDEADIEHFWIAEQGKGLDKKLIAYASANKRGNVLTTIYVDPTKQKKGIGQKLFTEVEKYLNPAMAVNLRVVSYNKNAIEFYKRKGFEKISTEEVDIDAGRIFPSDLMSREKSES